MRSKFHRAFSVMLFGYLLIMQPTVFLYRIEISKNFTQPETWLNYCPTAEDAISPGFPWVVSQLECAESCSRSFSCNFFSHYASNWYCYMYNFVPPKISYNRDCTFMMDRDSLHGCPTAARLEVLCNETIDQYYGCLTLTKINKTAAVCLAPPGLSVQMKTVNADFGKGPVQLPSVNNWILIMQRFDRSLDFDKNWDAYRNGFGNYWRTQDEFWLGNEIVHRLTNRTGVVYRLRVEVQLLNSGRWFYADYDTFSLDSENDKYAIHVKGFSGNAGDSLTHSRGTNFTTRDADNDKNPQYNCAADASGGWWFGYCSDSCFTCSYQFTFVWGSLGYLEDWGLLRAARMMIRAMPTPTRKNTNQRVLSHGSGFNIPAVV